MGCAYACACYVVLWLIFFQYKFDEADRELRSINSVWGQIGNSIKKDKKKVYDTNSKVDKREKGIRKQQSKTHLQEEKAEAKEQKKKEKEQKKRGLGASNPDLPPELGVLSKQVSLRVDSFLK